MLNQPNEQSFFTSDVIVLELLKKDFDCFEVSFTGKLVDEGRVRRVVVFKTASFAVIAEESESFIWVFNVFEVSDKRYWFAKESFGGLVRSVFVIMAKESEIKVWFAKNRHNYRF